VRAEQTRLYCRTGKMKDEIQIIERGQQGDEAAFGSLYSAYHQRMTGICQRIVGNHQVAEELAHDAFLLAFAKMDQLHNPRCFEAWLTSITTNVARRYMQRHHDPSIISLSTLSEEVIGSASPLVEELPGGSVSTEEKPLPTMAELMAAVDALPHGYAYIGKTVGGLAKRSGFLLPAGSGGGEYLPQRFVALYHQ